MKALIIDQVSEHIRPFLEKNGAEVDYVFLPTHDELRDMIGKYDLLVMRVDPRIDKEILDAAVNLKSMRSVRTTWISNMPPKKASP